MRRSFGRHCLDQFLMVALRPSLKGQGLSFQP
jgi:hypothetical protein